MNYSVVKAVNVLQNAKYVESEVASSDLVSEMFFTVFERLSDLSCIRGSQVSGAEAAKSDDAEFSGKVHYRARVEQKRDAELASLGSTANAKTKKRNKVSSKSMRRKGKDGTM
jgi:hypothetical protein